MQNSFSQAEKEDILKYFGKPLEELDPETFKTIRKQLMAKYHPDLFEKFGDDTIREMATDRFQVIERISQKLEIWFEQKGYKMDGAGKIRSSSSPLFAFDRMKIELITSDKDLKYNLFGASYKWLINGDSYKIPGTGASIVVDENYLGSSIGYREAVKFYLTFRSTDSLEDIVNWLFKRIEGRADSMIVEGEGYKVELNDMLRGIRKISLLTEGFAS